jgi:integrative and conjugative element protein (TIGR02256 family)
VTDAGVTLARRQLLDLVDVAGGAITLLSDWPANNGLHTFHISMDTSGLETSPAGVEVRERERFKMVVGPDFPFTPPSVWSVHERWARTPHVQWKNYLCLYAATSVEWNPSDGMRGFLGRLALWVENAAAGTLDPEGQPLHPPASYSSLAAGHLLVLPDLGDKVPWEADGTTDHSSTLVAWSKVRSDRQRVDVLEWIDLPTAQARAADPAVSPFLDTLPIIALPVVLTPAEFGSEYPLKFKDLSDGLAECGYDRDTLINDLASVNAVNRELRARQVDLDPESAGDPWDHEAESDRPLFSALIVGTPKRRVEGNQRLAHLIAWRLNDLSARVTDLFTQVLEFRESETVASLRTDVRDLAEEILDGAQVTWMRVMELRPEVTRRRDGDTPAAWLAGKSVLVLGAGALGAPIAEACVRAGVRALRVADKASVHPGILVRQPYADAEIGMNKAVALADRLSTIRSDLDVDSTEANVRTEFFGPDSADLRAYDLIIDATADASVRSAIEFTRLSGGYFPPLVTAVIGHRADKGLVTTNLRSATGAGADTFRKVSLLVSAGRAEWADIGEDLFPATARTDLFFPEPGCSSPTFIGSQSQVTALASSLLHEALAVLHEHDPAALDRGEPPVSFASAVRIGTAATIGTSRESWPADIVQTDASGKFEVRLNRHAVAEMRAEVRRGARVTAPGIETGGMLLGAFDDAIGVVFVDNVTGPPPDSYMSDRYFHHGTEETDERVRAQVARTSSASGFVGFWHSHPGGRAHPSPTDEQGMASVVAPDGTTRRALMMILGGRDSIWTRWRDELRVRAPDVYTRVVPRSPGPMGPGHPGYVGGTDLQRIPSGWYYRASGDRVHLESGAEHQDTATRTTRRMPAWWSRRTS